MAQITNYSGKYRYSVINTPYGDFFGWLTLKKSGNTYKGEIVNDEGKEFYMKVIKFSGNRLVFRSNIEGTNSLISCQFFGDSLRANVAVHGDDFPYILKGAKEGE